MSHCTCAQEQDLFLREWRQMGAVMACVFNRYDPCGALMDQEPETFDELEKRLMELIERVDRTSAMAVLYRSLRAVVENEYFGSCKPFELREFMPLKGVELPPLKVGR
jgi:hypothetical protein